MKSKNTVAQVLKVYAIINFIAGIILSFTIGSDIIDGIGIYFFAVSLVINFAIFAFGEVVQLLHDIKINTSNQTHVAEEETTATISPSENPVLAELVMGETYVIDGVCEFTLNRYELANEIHFADFDMAAPDNGNNIHLDFVFAYKNLGKSAVYYDDAARGLLLYADGYWYEASYAGDDFEIAPLVTEDFHIYFEVPKTIFDDEEPIEVNFTFNPYVDNDYKYTFVVDKSSL